MSSGFFPLNMVFFHTCVNVYQRVDASIPKVEGRHTVLTKSRGLPWWDSTCWWVVVAALVLCFMGWFYLSRLMCVCARGWCHQLALCCARKHMQAFRAFLQEGIRYFLKPSASSMIEAWLQDQAAQKTTMLALEST